MMVDFMVMAGCHMMGKEKLEAALAQAVIVMKKIMDM
jgi:hypothetical protein